MKLKSIKINLVCSAGDKVLVEVCHKGCAQLHNQGVLATGNDGHLVPGSIGYSVT